MTPQEIAREQARLTIRYLQEPRFHALVKMLENAAAHGKDLPVLDALRSAEQVERMFTQPSPVASLRITAENPGGPLQTGWLRITLDLPNGTHWSTRATLDARASLGVTVAPDGTVRYGRADPL